jgi:hypothetical protein
MHVVATTRIYHFRGFFYKCNPLLNVIVQNDPLQILLPKMAWREVEKVTRVFPPIQVAGSNLPPTQLAGSRLPLSRLWL